jgi:lipoyl(octanoyl) transferase
VRALEGGNVNWRWLVERESAGGAWNMAVDEALWLELEEGRSDRPVLRLYGWTPPTFSLGHHQRPERAVDGDFCRSRGYGVVVRPTGGKVVLHDEEVTYCVAGLQEAPAFAGGLAATYAAIAAALAGSLQILGLPVTLERRQRASSPKEPSPCFLVPTQRELLVGGKKVVGSAQKRGRRAFLQHGSIPIRMDYESLALGTGNPVSSIPAYRNAFAGLDEFLPELERETLRGALVRGFRATFPGVWEEGGLTGAEEATARALVGSKEIPALGRLPVERYCHESC